MYKEEISNRVDETKNEVNDIKFDSNHKGEIMVETILQPNYRDNNREANKVKIANYLAKVGCKVKKIKNSGSGEIKVYFKDTGK